MSYFGWGLEVSSQSLLSPFTLDTLLSRIGTIFNWLGMNQTKHCKRCDRELFISKFSKDRKTKDGLAFYCKDCISEQGEKYRSTPEGIYQNIKGRSNYYKKNNPRFYKPVKITQGDFIQWYNQQPKKCYYCDVPEEKINLIESFFNRKMLRLEVDCLINEEGYKNENMVLACHLCNFFKLHIFSPNEMREIAQKYIKPKWVSQSLIYSETKVTEDG